MKENHEIEYFINLIHNVWYEEETSEDNALGVLLRTHNPETDNNAILCVKENKIYIAFRGTENEKNIFSHFFGWPRKKIGKYKVHRGWFKNYLSIREPIIRTMSSIGNLEEKTVILVGHSMGAALASIAAIDFIVNKITTPRLFLLASPNFGCKKCEKLLADKTTSLINSSDYIWWVTPFMHRPPTTKIGKQKFALFSFKDHYPWDSGNNPGYISSIKKHYNLPEIRSPW